uniref:spermosin-like n=1 Tax=Styela clava TaxID=7725 RepID=UPI001939D53F|nr:spermosin-like [Styela clava]
MIKESHMQPNVFTKFCGGTIVSPRHVVTAFHCFPDANYFSDVRVMVGRHDEESTPGTPYEVDGAGLLDGELHMVYWIRRKTKTSKTPGRKCKRVSKNSHGYSTATEDMVWSLQEEYTVCAGNVVGQDTCQGNSGGPFLCDDNGQWTLYGATSWGLGCARGMYGAYASIAYSTEWICCYMADIHSCLEVDCDP